MRHHDDPFVPDDDQLATLESEELTDREVREIRRSQDLAETPDPGDPGVG